MEPFREIGSYYDLVYAEKDYQSEVEFVDSLILTHAGQRGTILDLGCGTGRHAVGLARLGYTVQGVDRSETMLEAARNRARDISSVSFSRGDVCSCRLGQTFDAVVSLFHVFSYQTTNERLRAAIETAAEHLRPGGVLIFDFWYGPAVLLDPPVVRAKKIPIPSGQLTRIATPTFDSMANTVTVHYDLLAVQNGTLKEMQESHEMRYLFVPELEVLLRMFGLKPLVFLEWLTGGAPNPSNWNAVCVATR